MECLTFIYLLVTVLKPVKMIKGCDERNLFQIPGRTLYSIFITKKIAIFSSGSSPAAVAAPLASLARLVG